MKELLKKRFLKEKSKKKEFFCKVFWVGTSRYGIYLITQANPTVTRQIFMTIN